MKLYGIAWGKQLPRPALLDAAREIAARELKRFERNDLRLGFIGAHDGRDADFVFVDFWGNENELFHRVFISRADRREQLAPAIESDSSVCVWDLKLQAFERDAWVKHVLAHRGGPDLEAYLNERLNADL